MTEHHKCSHVQGGATATVTCAMKALDGAPTRAVELDTQTELCTLCAARMISALVQLERDGALLRGSTVARP